MKKEHPILFSTPMVQALLEGIKTMTRRLVKPQPDSECEPNRVPCILGNEEQWDKWFWDTSEGERFIKYCPYGDLGDILWVRETFTFTEHIKTEPEERHLEYWYKADRFFERYDAWERDTTTGIDRVETWKPSIFMPREACRIFLEITDIKVERLNDISEQDAEKEGAEQFPFDDTFIQSFKRIWEKINGKESWKENPWVWVISFKRIAE